MNLADFTRPALLNPFLRAGDGTEAIIELSQALAAEGLVPDAKSFCDAVLARERLSPTDMAPGWALPHARVAGLDQPWFALGRTGKPVRWTSGTDVKLVMVLAAPDPDLQGHYLKLISTWAQMIKLTNLTERLLRADKAFQMFEALGGTEPRRAEDCAPYPDRIVRELVAARPVPRPISK